jgi:desulfoferrodoxin-like iron-binding protein
MRLLISGEMFCFIEGGNYMAVKKIGEQYRCTICGNEVSVTKAGGGTLVCCGKSMDKIN